MPACVIGGVSLVLYGMISAVGIRNLVENHVDFSKSRNVLVAAIILVLSLGIATSTAGAIVFEIGSVSISLSGLAIGSLIGIALNAILPDKDPFKGLSSDTKTKLDSFEPPMPLESNLNDFPEEQVSTTKE